MRTAFILEKDPKVAAEVEAALRSVDSKLEIMHSPDLEGFYLWVKAQVEKTKEQIAKEEIQLALIVSEIEFLGPRYYPLIEKARKMFARKGLCTAENLTPVVLTAYDSPDLEHSQIESRVISNVIFKPFDRPILDQHLRIALAGNQPVRDTTVFRQQIKTDIEMIKDVKLTSVSELSFTTETNRSIEVGRTSKYYSPWFVGGNVSSVLARCISCNPVSGKKDLFKAEFMFFGMNNLQGQNLRRTLFKKPVAAGMSKQNQKKGNTYTVLFLGNKTDDLEVRDTIAGKFADIDFVNFNSMEELAVYVDPSKATNKSNPEKSYFIKNPTLKCYVSSTGKVLGFNFTPEADAELFGYSTHDVTKSVNFFLEKMHFQDKERWQAALNNLGPQKPGMESAYLVFSPARELFGFQLLQLNKMRHRDFGACIELEIKGLSSAEVELYANNKPQRPRAVPIIFISDMAFLDGHESVVKDILDRLALQNRSHGMDQAKLFYISRKTLDETKRKKLSDLVFDIVYLPLDRLYLLKRIKGFFQDFHEKTEPLEIHSVETGEIISVANPVQLIDVSEAGLTMSYYRGISFGSFRRFRFKTTNETDDPVFIATCHYSEDNKKDGFSNQFVFFGITDRYLKHIRKWIKDSYILTKQSGNS